MINDLSSYSEAGRKAGIAVNFGDGDACKSWREHYQRMVSFERGADKEQASAAYYDAYKAARIVAKVR